MNEWKEGQADKEAA